MANRQPPNPQLVVANKCEKLLAGLTEDARQWVLAYLWANVLHDIARERLLEYVRATFPRKIAS